MSVVGALVGTRRFKRRPPPIVHELVQDTRYQAKSRGRRRNGVGGCGHVCASDQLQIHVHLSTYYDRRRGALLHVTVFIDLQLKLSAFGQVAQFVPSLDVTPPWPVGPHVGVAESAGLNPGVHIGSAEPTISKRRSLCHNSRDGG